MLLTNTLSPALRVGDPTGTPVTFGIARDKDVVLITCEPESVDASVGQYVSIGSVVSGQGQGRLIQLIWNTAIDRCNEVNGLDFMSSKRIWGKVAYGLDQGKYYPGFENPGTVIKPFLEKCQNRDGGRVRTINIAK